MWTLTAMRDNIPSRRVVFLPAVWERRSRLFRAMTHKNCFPGLIRLYFLFAVALTLAVPASAEWKEKVLYSFQGGTNDGAFPVGGVVFDVQGNLYGVLQDYGLGSCAPIGNECGAVFQLAPPAHKGDSWTETILYTFQGKGANDGESPNGGLIIDSQGNLYGVTAYGGTGNCVLLGVSAGCGTVYEISPPKQKGGAWTETILYSFPTSKQGYLPNGNLVFDSAGNLYGATIFGGGKGKTCDPFYQYCGAVFELSPSKTKGGKWTEKVLHGFASGTDGANPNGGFVLDCKGNVYGTTYGGGGKCGGGGCGMVFELKPPTTKSGAWTEKVLHRFSGQDGGNPAAGVVFDGNGNLYGTTFGGGANHSPWGTVFQLVPHANGRWTKRLLHTFQDGTDGAGPRAGILVGPSSELYGTASGGGGADFAGTLFRLKEGSMGGWTFTVLYTFIGVNNRDGAYPSGGILLNAGSIIGTTEVGGTGPSCQGGCGTVFKAAQQ
jgi:hypothetical protein